MGFAPDDLTRDKFVDGRLMLAQPVTGYRAATDPVFLAATVPALHLHDHLSTGHLNLLLLHFDAALLHLLDVLLVAQFLGFALLPLLESDARHDLHRDVSRIGVARLAARAARSFRAVVSARASWLGNPARQLSGPRRILVALAGRAR